LHTSGVSVANGKGADRRIYRRGFTDFSREGNFALGSLPLWGNSKFYFRVKSLPGVSPKPVFGLIVDSTVSRGARRRWAQPWAGWSLQDIFFLRGCYAQINHLFIPTAHLHCPPWCNTIAQLLDCLRLPIRTPVSYAMHHTILVMTISCKGQGAGTEACVRGDERGRPSRLALSAPLII